MKNSKWNKVCAALAVLCAMAVFPYGVSAASVQQRAEQITAAANQRIDNEVQKAQQVYAVLSQSGCSDDSVPVQRQIAILQSQTTQTAAQAEKELDKLGVRYECSYYTVTIGGSTVVIDPFLCVA